mmetsp:Transcript_10247/g.42359  ORF Transcript_10247/g.42359 Transcript_10247/m.42359 type:complete len:287 (+) Transcript_10247:1175-2035(+)
MVIGRDPVTVRHVGRGGVRARRGEGRHRRAAQGARRRRQRRGVGERRGRGRRARVLHGVGRLRGEGVGREDGAPRSGWGVFGSHGGRVSRGLQGRRAAPAVQRQGSDGEGVGSEARVEQRGRRGVVPAQADPGVELGLSVHGVSRVRLGFRHGAVRGHRGRDDDVSRQTRAADVTRAQGRSDADTRLLFPARAHGREVRVLRFRRWRGLFLGFTNRRARRENVRTLLRRAPLRRRSRAPARATGRVPRERGGVEAGRARQGLRVASRQAAARLRRLGRRRRPMGRG